jgi:predicted transcriptional regulator
MDVIVLFSLAQKTTRVVKDTSLVGEQHMPRLSRLEHVIMEALWDNGPASIRQIHESLPARKRPAYTTVQTIVNRLEVKKAVRRVRKIGNAFIFEALVSRNTAQKQFVSDLLRLFGGRAQPIMAQLISSGSLSLDDIKEAEELIKSLSDGDEKP